MSEVALTQLVESRLLASLHSEKHVSGLTHNFYRYPARMPPELAREAIQQFSAPGEFIIDPFMGGGTSVVEALALGRRAIGIDLNSLAHFVSSAKTAPLSGNDQQTIREWARTLDLSQMEHSGEELRQEPRVKNLPGEALLHFSGAVASAARLPWPRQRQFARCALLRLGQWAIDCKEHLPGSEALKTQLLAFVEEMLAGLNALACTARSNGVGKAEITGRRVLLLRSAVGAENDPRLAGLHGRPKLVITSPPYPGMHVLYHRWQVAGRRETPAPYWFIDAPDGHGAAHYTLGSRSVLGLENYFQTLIAAYRSMRALLHPEALVMQLIAFSDPSRQLPAFLGAMQLAGFREEIPAGGDRAAMWRAVPNRKWYYRVGAVSGTTRELLLFHRPCAEVENVPPTSYAACSSAT